LHFVHHQQDTILIAQLPDALPVPGWGNNIAAFSLDRFGKEGGDLLGGTVGAENRFLDIAYAVQVTRGIVKVKWAAVAVRIVDVCNARDQGRKAVSLYSLGCGE
jgi:hypothetical protein